MTRFVHLTDLHISHDGANDSALHSDTKATLTRAVAMIDAMDPQPDFIVVSGDLTNHGDVESYRIVQSLLAPLRPPVLLALGNHDSRAEFHSVFSGHSEPAPLRHDAAHGDLHVITLDSLRPGRVGGALGDDDFAFLDEALGRHSALAKLIVVHHPPRLDPAALPWESLDQPSTDRLAAALEGRRIAGVLSGHIHIDRVSFWRGAPALTCNGVHATVDILCETDMRILEGAGFGLCAWRPGGLSVSFVPVAPVRKLLGEIDGARLRAFA
ncbi:MAG: metallophosphoesterase [Paracoccaceae bacterium]